MIMIRRFATYPTLLLLLAGCGGTEVPSEQAATAPTEEVSAGDLVVYTVNYPLAYFAERIGGDLVEVVFPVPPGVDPIEWSPDAATVAAYQGADLILLNGADYAKWVARVSLPAGRLVDTSVAFADQLLPVEETVTHTHGPTGEHSHVDWASTTWLDPALAIEQGAAIRDALVAAHPQAESEIITRFGEFEADLLALDSALSDAANSLEGAPVLVSHPVYQYLIDRFDLAAKSVHWEPGEMPADEEWAKLEGLLATHPADRMLWEAEPIPEVRQRLESLGLEVIVFDPSPNRPPTGDWLSVMQGNALLLAGEPATD